MCISFEKEERENKQNNCVLIFFLFYIPRATLVADIVDGLAFGEHA